MKNLTSIITVFLLSIITSFGQTSEQTSLENSVLWKIEHSDLKSPSYLLGTLHFMCAEDFKIPEKVKQTLEQVDALVLEVNMTDPDEVKSIQESMLNQAKISEELTKEQFDELDTLVTDVLGMSLVNFDAYGLSTLNFFLMQKMLPCSQDQLKSLESELILLATNNNTPVASLEKAADQMEMIDKTYTTAYSFEQMMLFETYKKDFNNAIDEYQKENLIAAVNLITQKKYMNENATKYMQIIRNKNWVEKMPDMMLEKSNLFAVGAAHLTNEFGLIALLREKGYTITPVLVVE